MAPPRPAVATKFRAAGARGAGRTDHRRRRAHARPVHELAGDGRGRRRRARRSCRTRSSPSAICPSRRWSRAFAGRRRDVPVRDRRAVPGRRRPRVDALARRDRPDPVPPARRSAAVGAPRAARPGGVRPDRPATGGDAAGAGVRSTDPHRDRPRRRRRARSPARHRPLPVGHRPCAPADAAHPRTAPRPRSSSASWFREPVAD